MSLTITPYTEQLKSKWDAFVQGSRNGTVFHTRQFLAYHPEGRFKDHSLLFMDGFKIEAVLSAAEKDVDGKKMLIAHPGASYGGIVVKKDASVASTGELMKELIAYAKKKKFDGISMVRLVPSSIQRFYSEDQHYWLYQHGFTSTRVEMDGAINLVELSEEKILESFDPKCRNKIRQAERAKISVRLSTDFRSFWPILESLLGARHGVKPTHTLEEIEKLHSLLPKQCRLLAAYDGDKLIGGIVLVTLHDRAMYSLYMAQEYEYQKHHPMHMLVMEAIKIGLKEKRHAFHLGVSTEDGGKKINEGLFSFKESFGCRPVRRESFELMF